jgi:hypothetical protein
MFIYFKKERIGNKILSFKIPVVSCLWDSIQPMKNAARDSCRSSDWLLVGEEGAGDVAGTGPAAADGIPPAPPVPAAEPPRPAAEAHPPELEIRFQSLGLALALGRLLLLPGGLMGGLVPLPGLFHCAGLLRNERSAGMELQSEGRRGQDSGAQEGVAHFLICLPTTAD